MSLPVGGSYACALDAGCAGGRGVARLRGCACGAGKWRSEHGERGPRHRPERDVQCDYHERSDDDGDGASGQHDHSGLWAEVHDFHRHDECDGGPRQDNGCGSRGTTTRRHDRRHCHQHVLYERHVRYRHHHRRARRRLQTTHLSGVKSYTAASSEAFSPRGMTFCPTGFLLLLTYGARWIKIKAQYKKP